MNTDLEDISDEEIAAGAELIRQTGQSRIREIIAEGRIERLTEQRRKLTNAAAKARSVNDSDPRLESAARAVAQIDSQIAAAQLCYLAAWTPDNGFNRNGQLVGH